MSKHIWLLSSTKRKRSLYTLFFGLSVLRKSPQRQIQREKNPHIFLKAFTLKGTSPNCCVVWHWKLLPFSIILFSTLFFFSSTLLTHNKQEKRDVWTAYHPSSYSYKRPSKMFTTQNEIPLEWKENNVQSSNTGVTIQLLNSVNLKVFYQANSKGNGLTKMVLKNACWPFEARGICYLSCSIVVNDPSSLLPSFWHMICAKP